MTQASRSSGVEPSVGVEAEVDRAHQALGERLHLPRMIGVEDLDPALDEIREEIPAAIPGREVGRGAGRAEGPAGDRGDGVVVDRPDEPRVGRRPLARGPAVVAGGESLVDLFPGVLAHVVDEDPAGAGLDREAEGVAEPPSPDRPVLAAGRLAERIILGDRPVGVETQEFALQGRQLLGRRPGGLVADGDVELAIRAEMERAALVPGGDRPAEPRLVVALEEDELTAGDAPRPRRR